MGFEKEFYPMGIFPSLFIFTQQFLELFESKLLIDPAYIDRIKRHYALFKAHLGGKAIKKIYKGMTNMDLVLAEAGKN